MKTIMNFIVLTCLIVMADSRRDAYDADSANFIPADFEDKHSKRSVQFSAQDEDETNTYGQPLVHIRRLRMVCDSKYCLSKGNKLHAECRMCLKYFG